MVYHGLEGIKIILKKLKKIVFDGDIIKDD